MLFEYSRNWLVWNIWRKYVLSYVSCLYSCECLKHFLNERTIGRCTPYNISYVYQHIKASQLHIPFIVYKIFENSTSHTEATYSTLSNKASNDPHDDQTLYQCKLNFWVFFIIYVVRWRGTTNMFWHRFHSFLVNCWNNDYELNHGLYTSKWHKYFVCVVVRPCCWLGWGLYLLYVSRNIDMYIYIYK